MALEPTATREVAVSIIVCRGLTSLLLTGRPFACGTRESFVRCFVKRASMRLFLLHYNPTLLHYICLISSR